MAILKMFLDAYILFVVIFFFLSVVLKSKRATRLFLIVIFAYLLTLLTRRLDLKISYKIMKYLFNFSPIFLVVILAPEIRKALESIRRRDILQASSIGSQETKTHVVEAVMYLSENQIGALITVEKHNSLDVYADQAIMMNSLVTKELLINIFTPNTPLHDGAVIIKGDIIRCAGAYFDLSEREKEDKTMGSRHRAALGISETTDSLTLVVSEETGNISIVIDGIMIRANDKDKLYEYINMYLK